MVFPAVIKKGDAGVNRARHDLFGRFLIRRIAEMMAAEPKRRDLYTCLTKRSLWDFAVCHYRIGPARLSNVSSEQSARLAAADDLLASR